MKLAAIIAVSIEIIAIILRSLEVISLGEMLILHAVSISMVVQKVKDDNI